MKKLQNDIFFKSLMVIIAIFILLFIISYALLKHYILSLPSITPELTLHVVEGFNLVWMKISFVFFALLLGGSFILKHLQKNVYEDVESITEYIHEISENKNYESTFKIQHYLEFLQIAVGLKNIAKRLSQKDKKSSKK